MMYNWTGMSWIGYGAPMAIIWIAGFIFWIWMLIDCIQHPFKDKTEKIIWILVIIFTHIIGALIYFFIVKRKR